MPAYWAEIPDGIKPYTMAVITNAATTGQAMQDATAMTTAAIGVALNKGRQNGIELKIYEKVGIGPGGIEANNPWLQELPDPISKATWDNYVTIPRLNGQRQRHMSKTM